MSEELGTVLVIGGGGFLGSHIVKRLLSSNQATHIAIASRNPKADITDPRVSYHSLDITYPASVDAVFKEVQPRVVTNSSIPPYGSAKAALEATIVNGTKNLLAAARRCAETKAYVSTSSDSACRPSPYKQITEAECEVWSTTTYNNHYGRTKATVEGMVLGANGYELKTAVIRVPLIYGEGDTNFVPQVVSSIRKGEHKNQLGNNDKMWEFVAVESAAEAHVLAAKALLNNIPGAAGEAFFITDNAPMPFFDFMRKCYAAAGHPVAKDEIKVIPFWVVKILASVGEWLFWIFTFGTKIPKMRRADIDHLDAGSWWSIEKARRVLGYRPVMQQDEAVRKSMEWGMKNC